MPAPEAARFAFISYLRSDKATVEAIRARLEERGVRTWMDLSGVEAGANWTGLVENKIRAADAFILFVSRSLAERPNSFVHKEIDIAVERLKTIHPAVRWYYPVRLDESPIPARPISPGRSLSEYHVIDAFPTIEAAVEELATRIRSEWEQPEARAAKLVFRFLALPGAGPSVTISDADGSDGRWAIDQSRFGDDHEYTCLIKPGPKTIHASMHYVYTSVETGADRYFSRQSNALEIVANPKEVLVFSVRKSRRKGFLWLFKENGEWLTLDLLSRRQ